MNWFKGGNGLISQINVYHSSGPFLTRQQKFSLYWNQSVTVHFKNRNSARNLRAKEFIRGRYIKASVIEFSRSTPFYVHPPCRQGKSKFTPKDMKSPSRPPPPSRKKSSEIFKTSNNADGGTLSEMTFIVPILVVEEWGVKKEWSPELHLYSFHILFCCAMSLMLGEALHHRQWFDC